MNIRKILNILLLHITAIMCISCAWESRITFTDVVHDFGEVEQNQILNHDFTFKNTGNRKLIINKLNAG